MSVRGYQQRMALAAHPDFNPKSNSLWFRYFRVIARRIRMPNVDLGAPKR